MIHQLKVQFNARFEEVHRQKCAEVDRIALWAARLRHIYSELNMLEEPWVPETTAAERPEVLLEVLGTPKESAISGPMAAARGQNLEGVKRTDRLTRGTNGRVQKQPPTELAPRIASRLWRRHVALSLASRASAQIKSNKIK